MEQRPSVLKRLSDRGTCKFSMTNNKILCFMETSGDSIALGKLHLGILIAELQELHATMKNNENE